MKLLAALLLCVACSSKSSHSVDTVQASGTAGTVMTDGGGRAGIGGAANDAAQIPLCSVDDGIPPCQDNSCLFSCDADGGVCGISVPWGPSIDTQVCMPLGAVCSTRNPDGTWPQDVITGNTCAWVKSWVQGLGVSSGGCIKAEPDALRCTFLCDFDGIESTENADARTLCTASGGTCILIPTPTTPTQDYGGYGVCLPL